MKKERKYLDEFEMGLLEKSGIKRLKKKYDVNDLLDMLPKRWKEGNKENHDENGIAQLHIGFLKALALKPRGTMYVVIHWFCAYLMLFLH